VPLALLLGSTVITLALLEVGLTLAGFTTAPVDIQIARQSDARTLHVFEDDNFEHHPDLIWTPRRSHSVFNGQAFRGPEIHAPKAAGELRLFAVGDSNTLGWAGPDGAHWPADLARLIDTLHPRATVVNAGVWGYTSYQGVRRVRQTLAFDPDIILVSFGSNDAHWVVESDREYDARAFRHTDFGRALEGFRLGELVLAAIERATRPDASLGPRVSLDDYRANLVTMVEEGRARGADVVLLTRPYMGPIDNPLWWKNRAADYAAATADVADSLGVMLVDVYSIFKGRDDLFADESHFTDEGHRLAADVIFDHIKPLIERRRPASAPALGNRP
jgi:lysophospholipase L1-like esterase